MNDRLKVSDFYQTPRSTCLFDIPDLQKALFLKEWLFVVSSSNLFELHQFDLMSKQKIETIQMPQKGLGGIEQIEGRLCLFFQNKQELWVYHKQKIIKLQSHFGPITAIINYNNQILTGSADITLRRWNICHQGLVQDSKLHVLTGHTNTIISFLTVSDYLLSASKDRSVILWKGTKNQSKKLYQTPIDSMIHCKQSEQLAFIESSKKVWILSQRVLVLERKLQTVRKIEMLTINPIKAINQIDFSFLQIVGDEEMEIAQINLGTTMAKINLQKKERKENVILATKCIRRLSLYAIRNQGINMISF